LSKYLFFSSFSWDAVGNNIRSRFNDKTSVYEVIQKLEVIMSLILVSISYSSKEDRQFLLHWNINISGVLEQNICTFFSKHAQTSL